MKPTLRSLCQHVPTPEGMHCETCGMRLDSSPPRGFEAPPMAPTRPLGALWLEDLQSNAERPTEPMLLHQPEPEPTLPPITLTLRDVKPPPSPPPPPPPPPAAAAPVAPPPAAPVTPAAPAPPAVRVSPRIARRAAVRRARRAQSPAASATVADVLAFDPGVSHGDTLHSLLNGFGFSVHAVGDPGLARDLMATRRFAAVFVDVLLDATEGDAGLDLCRHAKAQARARGDESATLVVLVSAKLSPTQRVAAELAGFDAILAKPVTRGSVAQVLDGRGIALPVDPRHD